MVYLKKKFKIKEYSPRLVAIKGTMSKTMHRNLGLLKESPMSNITNKIASKGVAISTFILR